MWRKARHNRVHARARLRCIGDNPPDCFASNLSAARFDTRNHVSLCLLLGFNRDSPAANRYLPIAALSSQLAAGENPGGRALRLCSDGFVSAPSCAQSVVISCRTAQSCADFLFRVTSPTLILTSVSTKTAKLSPLWSRPCRAQEGQSVKHYE